MLGPDLERVLKRYGQSCAQSLAIARLAAGKNTRPAREGFLTLEPGHDLEILAMEGGPSGAWIARDHKGQVGFVSNNDVVVQRFDIDQSTMDDVLSKAKLDAAQDPVSFSASRQSVSPASSTHSSVHGGATSSPTPLTSRPTSSQNRRARRKSSSMIHRLISRPNSLHLEPHEMYNCLEERRRSVSIGAANAIKSHKRAPPGYLELNKGDNVEVLATRVDELPDGVWIGRDAKGQVGFVDSSDVHMGLGYLKFGQDLTESCKGTRRRIPKVVESCIAFLAKHGLEEEGIFRVSGRTAHINRIQEAFENDVDLLQDATPREDLNVHAVSSVLKLFLRRLPNPVFTRNLHDSFLEIARVDGEGQRVARLQEMITNYLPAAHAEVLRTLLNFLHKVAQYAEKNKMSEANLATVFAPTLMRRTALERPTLADLSAQNMAMQDDPLVKELLVTCIKRVDDIFVRQTEDEESRERQGEPWRRLYVRRQLSQSPHSRSSSFGEEDQRRARSGVAVAAPATSTRPASSSSLHRVSSPSLAPVSSASSNHSTPRSTLLVQDRSSAGSELDMLNIPSLRSAAESPALAVTPETGPTSDTRGCVGAEAVDSLLAGGHDDIDDAAAKLLHMQLDEHLQLPADVKRWTGQHVATYLRGCGLGISERALGALASVSGRQLIALNKDALRHQFKLQETDVAKIASLIFQLADPRAQ